MPDFSRPMPAKPVGRLAPSPTGLLHLGNVFTFLICWLLIRSAGGKLILRIDDLDPQRSKKEFSQQIVKDLKWLGIDWDEGPEELSGGYQQSQRTAIYESSLARLSEAGLVYPCFCTRKELRQMASAPHMEDVPYPGKCARLKTLEIERLLASKAPHSFRLRCPLEKTSFTDLIQGKQDFMPDSFGGDFALRRSDGVFSYQLATAVDDAQMGITLVARGKDLLSSTPRQLLLMNHLGYEPPAYAHLPLLLDARGERLAKRHKSLSIAAIAANGVSPALVIGILGKIIGANPSGAKRDPFDLLAAFSINKIPENNQVIAANDLAKLL